MGNNMNAYLIPLDQKINRRVGHVAVSHKGKLLVWGGYMEYADEDETTCYHHATDELFVYEPYSEIWDRKLLKGDIPPRSSGGCGVVLGDTLYLFGGVVKGQSEFDGNTNNLYALDLRTLTWTLLKPVGNPPVPCEKLVGWEYNGKVYFFGGYGPTPLFHVFFDTEEDTETGSSWNNQLIRYNPKANAWEWPPAVGKVPSPRAAHAGDKCGHLMFISGGRLNVNRMNDLHVLDLDTMEWSGNINESSEYVPAGRSWHTFTFISPHEAVLYGGFSTYNNVLNDFWTVDISMKEYSAYDDTHEKNTRRWKAKYSIPPSGHRFSLRRFWHKTVYLDKTGDLICFGGFNRFNNPPEAVLLMHGEEEDCAPDEDLKPDHPDTMLTIHLKPLTLLRLSLNATLKYHQTNQHLWETVPRSLQDLLTRRFSQIYP